MSAPPGFECDLHGLPGDGTTYEPPNQWADPHASLRLATEPPYFGKVVPTFSLPPPPPPPVVQGELALLRRLQADERTLMRAAIDFEKYDVEPVFERALGIEAAAHAGKSSVSRLIRILCETAQFWIVKQKAQHNRPRPVQLAPDLDPPFCPGHASYPSGHAGESYAAALGLVDALARYPALRGTMIDTAVAIGRHREVAGVHYPSDSECGRRLASQLLAALRADKGYQDLVAAARVQLEALLGPP